MHFGLYLHRQGIVTAEQLVAALDVQTRSLVRIGQLALEEGILSAREVFDVLRSQCDAPRERFGELAIEMGLMTRDELMRLLTIQASRQPPLEEILIRQRVLTPEQVETERSAFRQTGVTVTHPAASVRPLRPPHMQRSPRSATFSPFAT
jgi:hypothetical protein